MSIAFHNPPLQRKYTVVRVQERESGVLKQEGRDRERVRPVSTTVSIRKAKDGLFSIELLLSHPGRSTKGLR